jgi:hypothetical protein
MRKIFRKELWHLVRSKLGEEEFLAEAALAGLAAEVGDVRFAVGIE